MNTIPAPAAPDAPALPDAPATSKALAQHHPSHRFHLRKLTTGSEARRRAPRLDAIVMPTSRRLDEPRSGVHLAATLAEALGDTPASRPSVVLLCSGAARSEHLPRSLFAGTSVLTIDLPPDYRPMWPRLKTSEHVLSHQRRNDVGVKRNLGLVLARARSWKNILLLDDDVRRLRSDVGPDSPDFGVGNIADALNALTQEGIRCAGWVAEQFADNSVVCHARRLAGLPQDKFVGGGALLLRCDGRLPFFPATYNEDWLFLHRLMVRDGRRHRTLIEGGRVGQDPYRVYVGRRARAEELGDVLGEGLFNLLTRPESDFVHLCTSLDYWREVVAARSRMIGEVIDELGRLDDRQSGQAIGALRAALGVHDLAESGPEHMVTYCRSWLQDLELWGDWLSTVTEGSPGGLGFVEHRQGR